MLCLIVECESTRKIQCSFYFLFFVFKFSSSSGESDTHVQRRFGIVNSKSIRTVGAYVKTSVVPNRVLYHIDLFENRMYSSEH
jgi:hypothetical protein